MAKKIVYLRTDKNGTKYYANYTCPRCGGAGGGNQWIYTGWTCYECGGTGERSTPVIEKEYTPEYAAKLEERRATPLGINVLPDDAFLFAFQVPSRHLLAYSY